MTLHFGKVLLCHLIPVTLLHNVLDIQVNFVAYFFSLLLFVILIHMCAEFSLDVS
jgi:hypothetical protein